MKCFSRKCAFFNCAVREGTQLYHIVYDLYAYLCVGHARMSLSARHSTVALIEFLISMKGSNPEYRNAMRKFVIQEASRKIDGR